MTRRALVAQTKTECILTMRRGESLLATLGIPVAVLVFFTAVEVVDTGFDEPLDFLVPGVLTLSVIATAMVNLGISTGFERRYGVLKRLGTTPLGRGALVGAKVSASAVLLAVQFAVVIGVAVALGWGVSTRLVPASGVMVLGSAAFGGLGLLMAGTLRAEATLALTNALYVAFILVGGIAVPLERLPGPIEYAAMATPAAQLAETMRATLVPGIGFEVWAVGGLVGWAFVAPLLAVSLFQWEEG